MVIKRANSTGNSNQAYWLCKCDCGNTIVTVGYCLRSGDTKSCGCLLNENRGKSSKTHGMTKTRLYHVWLSMKERCYTSTCNTYKNYGGRGIKICDEWLGENGFVNFKEWSLANGYAEDLSIDRIDVNGNYEPSNCRWATRIQQANNKRNNVYITIDGEVHTLTEWCKILNVSRSTVTKRKGKGLPQELWFYKGRLK